MGEENEMRADAGSPARKRQTFENTGNATTLTENNTFKVNLDVDESPEPPKVVVHQANVVEGGRNVPHSQLSAAFGRHKGGGTGAASSTAATANHPASDLTWRPPSTNGPIVEVTPFAAATVHASSSANS